MEGSQPWPKAGCSRSRGSVRQRSVIRALLSSWGPLLLQHTYAARDLAYHGFSLGVAELPSSATARAGGRSRPVMLRRKPRAYALRPASLPLLPEASTAHVQSKSVDRTSRKIGTALCSTRPFGVRPSLLRNNFEDFVDTGRGGYVEFRRWVRGGDASRTTDTTECSCSTRDARLFGVPICAFDMLAARDSSPGAAVLLLDTPICCGSFFRRRGWRASPLVDIPRLSHGAGVAAALFSIAPRTIIRRERPSVPLFGLKWADIIVCAWTLNRPHPELEDALSRHAEHVFTVRSPGHFSERMAVSSLGMNSPWELGPVRLPGIDRELRGASMALGYAAGAASLLVEDGMSAAAALRMVSNSDPEGLGLLQTVGLKC